MDREKPDNPTSAGTWLKLLVVCLLCLGLITGLVLLIQVIT